MKTEFVRVHSVKDIVVFSVITIAGLALSFIHSNTAVCMTGCFLVFVGILLMLFLKTGYKDIHSGEHFRKVERYFQQAMHESIKAAINSNPNSIDLSEEDKGNALRLDVYFNKTTDKAFLQLFEYVPYSYQACSDIVEHDIKDVEKLLK